MFGFQVHEKSILLPLLSINMLIDQDFEFVVWFNNVALYSMWPLFQKDGLQIPYIASLILWNTLAYFQTINTRKDSVKTINNSNKDRVKTTNNKDSVKPINNTDSVKKRLFNQVFKSVWRIDNWYKLSYLVMAIIHSIELLFIQPIKLPHLFIVLNQFSSFLLFLVAILNLNLNFNQKIE